MTGITGMTRSNYELLGLLRMTGTTRDDWDDTG